MFPLAVMWPSAEFIDATNVPPALLYTFKSVSTSKWASIRTLLVPAVVNPISFNPTRYIPVEVSSVQPTTGLLASPVSLKYNLALALMLPSTVRASVGAMLPMPRFPREVNLMCSSPARSTWVWSGVVSETEDQIKSDL